MVAPLSTLCVLPLVVILNTIVPAVLSTPVFDPCYNYTVLDEPWRATTNDEESGHCDSKRPWHGWYRMMYYGWNVRIPEKCVTRGCGTAGGVWMNGVHPQLKDGIVTRSMCKGSWSYDDCCQLKAASIRVKACPGNYYVYELVAPNGCNFAYCADVDTISSPTPVPQLSSTATTNPCDKLHCTESEKCGEAYGIHGCVCRSNYVSHTYGSRVLCRKTATLVYLTRCLVFEAGFPLEVLHLNDPTCRPKLSQHYIRFEFNLIDKACGTQLKVNKTHIIYENSVQGKVNFTEGHISRQRRFNMQFACIYPVSYNVSMGDGIHTLKTSNVDLMVPQKEKPSVYFNPYKDADFTERFSGNVSLQSDERIYISVTVGLYDLDARQFSNVLDSCWATPINDPTSSVRWDLITNQCPNPKDGTVEVLRNGLATESRFSFRVFTFDGFPSMVYLHCSLHICSLGGLQCIPNCNPVHLQRARRSADKQDKITISSEPLSFPAISTDVLDVRAPQPMRRSLVV